MTLLVAAAGCGDEPPGPGPAEQFHASERSQLVRGALEELPPKYREALFLVYIEGMAVDETARTLGVPSGTVKSRLKRGRDALKKLLDDSNEDVAEIAAEALEEIDGREQ